MKIKIIQDIIDLCRRKILFRDLFLYNFYHDKLTEKQMRSVLNLSKKLNKFKITVDKKTDMLLCNNKNISFYVDPYYPVIAREIFGDNIYDLRDNNLNKNEKYTVLDIGANHGYASLYFAEKPWCENVYAFELVPEIAKYAEDNFKLNKNLKNKMNLFSFGLGKNNEETFAFSDGRDYAVSLSKECILKTSKNPDLIKKIKFILNKPQLF